MTSLVSWSHPWFRSTDVSPTNFLILRRFADAFWTFRRQPLGRFADMYNIVYMTFKAIHMLIAKSSSLQTDRQNIIVDGTTSRLPEEVVPPLHADVLTQ